MPPPQSIFPPHVPGVCHPNVNSMATLIEDLDDESTALDITSSSVNCNEVKRIGKHCNLYGLQLERIKADLERIKADDDRTRYTNGKISELTALSKLASLNYKYCVASQSCPTRMNVLNRCYMSFKPDAIKRIFESGRHDLICKKEKNSVERCVGGLIMSSTRDLC